MSKFGINLALAAAAAFTGAGYYTQRYPGSRRPGTYENLPPSERLPGEIFKDQPRVAPERMTNPLITADMLTTFAGGPPAAANPCAGVNTTFTSIGIHSWTSTCTGTVNMSVWGTGGGIVAAPNYVHGGGGAFAKSPIAVTLSQGFTVYLSFSNTLNTFVCPALVANCNKTLVGTGTVCNTPSGLSTSNFVCAATGSISGGGGLAANSVGITKFSGGIGTSAGGGAAGPDGAGLNSSGSTGGAGDNGLGGAGGTYNNAGANNPLGGGGGGGGFGAGAHGGYPGGGGGGYSNSPTAGGTGQVVIHGELDPQLRILNGDTGYGGGTLGSPVSVG